MEREEESLSQQRLELPPQRESFEYFDFDPAERNEYDANSMYSERIYINNNWLPESETAADIMSSVNSTQQLLPSSTTTINNGNSDNKNKIARKYDGNYDAKYNMLEIDNYADFEHKVPTKVNDKTTSMLISNNNNNNNNYNNNKNNSNANNVNNNNDVNINDDDDNGGDNNDRNSIFTPRYITPSAWELLKRKIQHWSATRWLLLWMSLVLIWFALMMIATAFRLPNHRAAGIKYTFARENIVDEENWTALPLEPNSQLPSTESIASVVGGTLNLILNPPLPMEWMEFGLLWCGVPAIAVVVCGVFRVLCKSNQLRRIYSFTCIFASALCGLFVVLGLKWGYLGGTYDEINTKLRLIWEESQFNAREREALWLISAAFTCSGYDVCCEGVMLPTSSNYSASWISVSTELEVNNTAEHTITNLESVTEKVNLHLLDKQQQQQQSDKVCFRQVAVSSDEQDDNTNITNTSSGNVAATVKYVRVDDNSDITERVEQQCRYYINSTRTHNIKFTTPCGPVLLGRVSTGVAFALSAIFSVGVFCAVNHWFSRVIHKDNAEYL